VSHPDPATLRPPPLVQRGLVAGIVVAAALHGFLVGIGHRAGTAWRPLNAAAHTLIGARADGVWDFDPSVTPVGGLVVLAMSVLAGFAVARIASSFRRMHVVAAAAGVSFVGYLLHLHVAARTPGGLAALLSIGELRALYLVLALAVMAGMRFAFFPVVQAPRR
jgi:hypothetical protein